MARGMDAAWGGLGLAGLALGWTTIHLASGPFVLPSLADTGAAFVRLFAVGAAPEALGVTLIHALGGALLGGLAGAMLGVAGGLIRPLGATLRPVALAILGVPPVAWVVLALLWFGPGLVSPLFTVAVTTAPILFAAALGAVATRDSLLTEMATVFRLSRRTRLTRLLLPEMAAAMAPALSTGFALAWKVALTAELLGDGSGIGGRFATARAHLDLAEAMAWVVLVVIFVLLSDAVMLAPLRRWIGAGRRGRAMAPAVTRCVGVGVLTETRRC
jgi:NitT/TauT family transport system permease protein